VIVFKGVPYGGPVIGSCRLYGFNYGDNTVIGDRMKTVQLLVRAILVLHDFFEGIVQRFSVRVARGKLLRDQELGYQKGPFRFFGNAACPFEEIGLGHASGT
jgi:hypothetical protein